MSTAKTIRTTTRLVTTTTDLGTDFGMRYFSTGLREYNVTGWHVSPLHHGAYMESTRALKLCQQTKTSYESIGKPTLKCQEQKCRRSPHFIPRRAATTPHQSISTTPTPPKSIDTFRPVMSVELMVTSLMSSLGRLQHEDRAGTS